MRLKTLLAALALAALSVPAAAHTTQYTASLFGANENPVQNTPGVGVGIVTFDSDTLMMQVQAAFNGLLGNVTIAHIHCCIAPPGNVRVATPVPSFPGFPAGGTFGFYDHTLDMSLMSSYNPDFITNNGGTVGTALNAFITGLDAGQAYLNIHTSFAGGGEIRGFLQAVPEPETYALMLAGLAVLGWIGARRRKL
jgi:hypothetical protein